MSTVNAPNPLYDTYLWTLSPNGTLYVLRPAMGQEPAKAIRLGRVNACTHRSKHVLTSGTQVSALVLRVMVDPEAAGSSAEHALQSPTMATQQFYIVAEAKFGTFTKHLPSFASHEGAVAAFKQWKEKPNSKDCKQGKWMKSFLINTVRTTAADPRLSNPSLGTSTPRQLNQEFDDAVRPTPSGGPAVFAAQDRQTPTQAPPRSRESVMQEVAGLTSSQPLAGELLVAMNE